MDLIGDLQMKGFFALSILVMGKMKFPTKFGSIFVIVLAPLIYLSYNMVHILTEEINFLENEIKGVTYLQAARLPLQHIQQHRGMTAAYLNGASEFKPRIMSKRRDVDKYLAQLQQTENELGEALQTKDSTGDRKSVV